MSRELEALEVLQNYIMVNEPLETQEPYLQRLKTIRDTLTPPTEQEVCKALKILPNDNIHYVKKEQSFYRNQEPMVLKSKYTDTIHVAYMLNAKQYIIIGRFYEGKVKE